MEDWIWILVPIMALLIPIVAILVKHQQRMAELIHSPTHQANHSETQQLRHEIQELKQLVHQQALTIDSLNSRLSGGGPAGIQDRIGS